ncbi:MAG: PD-(D/E)XK nuclease family protein [Acidimicrobiales bacterium]|nr:PD-(D/E)XK nuclease family protein [Acidimicrobiales bacterium]
MVVAVDTPTEVPASVAPVASTEPRHLSPSSAVVFEQCPRRWRFRYLDRLPDPPGEAALVGTFVHRILERLLGEVPAERTVERARAIAAEEWPAHRDQAEVAALGLDADGVRRFKWQVWQAVNGLWHLEDPTGVEVVATEQRLDVQLGAVPFLGVLDRVDATADGVVVSDYKSGRAPGGAYVADKLEQVLLYAAAWRADSGTQPKRARLLYLGARSIEIEVTADRLDQAVGRLHERWDALNDCVRCERFEPRTGPLCAWCPFAAQCPEGSREIRRRLDAGLVPPHAPAVRHVA